MRSTSGNGKSGLNNGITNWLQAHKAKLPIAAAVCALVLAGILVVPTVKAGTMSEPPACGDCERGCWRPINPTGSVPKSNDCKVLADGQPAMDSFGIPLPPPGAKDWAYCVARFLAERYGLGMRFFSTIASNPANQKEISPGVYDGDPYLMVNTNLAGTYGRDSFIYISQGNTIWRYCWSMGAASQTNPKPPYYSSLGGPFYGKDNTSWHLVFTPLSPFFPIEPILVDLLDPSTGNSIDDCGCAVNQLDEDHPDLISTIRIYSGSFFYTVYLWPCAIFGTES